MTDHEPHLEADLEPKMEEDSFIAPVAMEEDPDELFAGDRGSLDSVVRRVLVRAGQTEVLLDGLNQPHGVTFAGDSLYIAESDRVDVYAYRDGSATDRRTRSHCATPVPCRGASGPGPGRKWVALCSPARPSGVATGPPRWK